MIGVGHRHRRDDAVGPYVAEAMAARGWDAVAHEADGAGLLDLWDDADRVILVDAMDGRETAGTVHRFAPRDGRLETANFIHSTHRFGVAEAIALGGLLGRLPDSLTVIGVAGADFGYGDHPSPPVLAAADELIAELDMELSEPCTKRRWCAA